MEIQRGVVGDLSSFPDLAAAAQQVGLVANTARLLSSARAAGVPVVHCTAGFRADRRGSPANAPLIATLLRRPEHLVDGTPAVELVPELGAEPDDLVSHRAHGVSPFTGTALDATLRALGVTTVVATGVSLNLGIVGPRRRGREPRLPRRRRQRCRVRRAARLRRCGHAPHRGAGGHGGHGRRCVQRVRLNASVIESRRARPVGDRRRARTRSPVVRCVGTAAAVPTPGGPRVTQQRRPDQAPSPTRTRLRRRRSSPPH